MLNIHGEILDLLNESEYFLFCILLNYGNKSCPDNGVLLHRTGWGLNKLQATKKSLISKGILTIEARFNLNKGEKGRESNYYIITTDLASKYCDKVPQNKVVKNQLVNNKLVNNKLDDFGVHKELLKSTIIETTKVLKDKRGKVLFEKNYPPTFTAELIECFEEFLTMRKKIGRPLKLVQDKVNFLAKHIEKIGVEAVQAAVQNSIDNEYQGIFPKALKNGAKAEPTTKYDVEGLKKHCLDNFSDKKIAESFVKSETFNSWVKLFERDILLFVEFSNKYKNEKINPYSVFEIIHGKIGGFLHSNDPVTRLKGLDRFIASLSEYDQSKGDLRKLAFKHNEKQAL